jgi:hypothetical protein
MRRCSSDGCGNASWLSAESNCRQKAVNRTRALFTDILDFCGRVLAISVRQGVIERRRWIGVGEGVGPSQDAAVGFSRDSVKAEEFAIARPVGLPDHAAALIDGHVVQDADRLAATRAQRAAADRDLKYSGTASPV